MRKTSVCECEAVAQSLWLPLLVSSRRDPDVIGNGVEECLALESRRKRVKPGAILLLEVFELLDGLDKMADRSQVASMADIEV